MGERTEPVPSKCPGWFVAADGKGFTSQPQYAAQRPATDDEREGA